MATCANVSIVITPTTIIALDTAATVSPSSAQVGDPVTIQGVLRNTGNTAGTVYVGVSYQGTTAGRYAYSVPAGGATPVSLQFNASGSVGSTASACLVIVP